MSEHRNYRIIPVGNGTRHVEVLAILPGTEGALQASVWRGLPEDMPSEYRQDDPSLLHPVNESGGRIYAYDLADGSPVYRIPGHRHGDGQVDSDEHPVWLLCSYRDLDDAGINPAALPGVEILGPDRT